MIAGFEKDIRSLLLRAIDEFDHIQRIQVLIDMSIDDALEPDGKTINKLVVLLDSHRIQFQGHADEVNACLTQIRSQLLGKEPDCDRNSD